LPRAAVETRKYRNFRSSLCAAGAVGRHDTHSKNRAAFGSVLSAPVSVAARAAVGRYIHSQLLDISWSVGHGDIFYSVRRDSSVWPLLLLIRS
jgi:hypothetical protein